MKRYNQQAKWRIIFARFKRFNLCRPTARKING